jgi:hypothetical protein
MTDIRTHIAALVHPDQVMRETARQALLIGDEAIIAVLIDEFYAGVNLSLGIALLDIIGQIGGYEARMLLEDIADDPKAKAEWRQIGLGWLKRDGFR